jgi:DNA helicase-2/ATP-dependent DNA helicase PcrA
MTSDFERRYAQLNTRQRQAVDVIDGPVLVIAGPGSGKTELLSLRVANILLKADVNPGNVLCLTFTEAAAQNMRERLAGLIGETAYRVAVHTFHSFGVDVINRHPETFYEGASFQAADELTQLEILEQLFQGLSFGDALRSEHPEEGFVYLNDARSAISNLKRAGLTPAEFTRINTSNTGELENCRKAIHTIFDPRLSVASFGAIKKLVQDFSAGETLLAAIGRSLSVALDASIASGKTAPLSAWKSSHLGKTEDGRRCLKEELALPQLRSLETIYAAYQAQLFSRRLYDFDDMLLRVVEATERDNALKSELQEQFQYLLVDEFQDTNDAQMRLLRNLTDAEVNEGRPNVMAVGDDDQAIYKFQGAELANIIGFRTLYRDPEIITLNQNYRSTQAILDLAVQVIRQGEGRLENLLPEIAKDLVAANPNVVNGTIKYPLFPTKEHEYLWIGQEAQRLLQAGTPAREIAVIARTHHDLETLVPFLHAAGLPLRYERQQNVFEQSHIRQLIVMARFVCSLGRHQTAEADYLLPELLAYPCWNVPRGTLWELGAAAYAERRLWLQLMQEHSNPKLRDIANLLIELGERSAHEPLEELLTLMIGADPHEIADSDEDEGGDKYPSFEAFRSPFKAFYFGQDTFTRSRLEYLSFLSGLKVFVEGLRRWRPDDQLHLDDLVAFVDLYEKNGLSLRDTSPFVNAVDAIRLLTAHGAKGLEFETVFILNCQEDAWTSSGRGNKIHFPANLPLAPGSDTIDDHLRLFYVALTRAKRHLYLPTYKVGGSGKDVSRLQFLIDLTPEPSPLASDEIAVLQPTIHGSIRKSLPGEERAILQATLERYALNPTHLNNFLDVTRGGPRSFLEQNLLRFPQPKSASGAFGSAIHATLNQISVRFRAHGIMPALDEARGWFDQQLDYQRLSETECRLYTERGRAVLQAFYAEKLASLGPNDATERDFSSEHVRIGGIPVNGKIDRLTKEAHELVVHDYKTGKPAVSWQGRTIDEKIKLHNYRHQLTFYKLLVEHSRELGANYSVRRGILEFVEPERGSDRLHDLELYIDPDEAERLTKLIIAVDTKIRDLDFPDITGYAKTIAGIESFENDLLSGTA